MRLLLLALASAVILNSCEKQESRSGGFISFELDDSTQVVLETGPLEVGSFITIKNSSENIILRPISDGVFSVPVFGGSISGEWDVDQTSFRGVWTDSLRPGTYTVPVEITPEITATSTPCSHTEKIEWNTSEGRLVASVGCGKAIATFLTPTGDYRFLSGVIDSESLKLVTFDGAHLFHITAEIRGDSLVNGVFKSGTHYAGEWSGTRAHEPKLPFSSKQKANSNYEFKISGIDENGDTVIWDTDAIRAAGKRGLVLDVLGTWCPNCYDEIKLLKSLKKDHPDVQFISLAFERGDLNRSIERIASFKEELSVDWPILYGGKASKAIADSVAPFLGGVKSFPTTAFISLENAPIIHTGFNGPATDRLYKEEVRFFQTTLDSL